MFLGLKKQYNHTHAYLPRECSLVLLLNMLSVPCPLSPMQCSVLGSAGVDVRMTHPRERRFVWGPVR